MEVVQLKNIIILISILILFNSSGCTNKALIQNKNITNIKSEEKKIKSNTNMDFDEKLIHDIKDSINDTNWYDGEYSEFGGFNHKKLNSEVYVNRKDSSLFYIYFTDKIRNEKLGVYEYYVISIAKVGENYILNGYFTDTKSENIIKSLKDDGYLLYKKITVNFDNVKLPTFSPLSKDKLQIINNIKSQMTNALKFWSFKKGKYKIYIKNFNESDKETIVLIEKNKHQWFLNINFNEDGSISIGDLEKVSYPIDRYEAGQYKKVSFSEEINY